MGNGPSERGSQPRGKNIDPLARARRKLSDQKGRVLDPPRSHPKHLEKGEIAYFLQGFLT